jgi:hypothetical protein
LNKKITNAKFLSDGLLWICTYKGLVIFDPKTEKVSSYFPNISFTDALIDKHGNYWFSTIQNGLMRVSSFNSIVWNEKNKSLINDKITKITTDGKHIYFSCLGGTIGKIYPMSAGEHKIESYHTGINADVQSLDYDTIDHRLYFNLGKLFYLKDYKILEKECPIKVVKSLKKIKNDFILLSSYGIYVEGKDNGKYKISDSWSREYAYSAYNNTFYVASNNGILHCAQSEGRWFVKDSILYNTQFVSLDFQDNTNNLYALSFRGDIYCLDNNNELSSVATIPENIQANQIKYFENKIYVSTNKGIWIFDLTSNSWDVFNSFSGLVSDNVQ